MWYAFSYYGTILIRTSEWRWKPIIVQNREEPLLLKGIRFTLKRLHPDHEVYPLLDTKAVILKAGLSGEEKLAEVLRNETFSFAHHIIHDLSLESCSLFQIDSLFLTPYYAVVFEVKNISGRLKFIEKPPQLIRTRETGEVDGFESPAAQVERNSELLGLWLSDRGIQIPLYRVVVLAYPKQIVEKAPTKTRVLFPSLVPSFLRSLPREKTMLDQKTFKWLTESLLSSRIQHIPRPVCEMYNISRSAIRTGVICVDCGMIGMVKIKRSWRCEKCGRRDPKAHEQAIREWFLLIGRELTNRDCRDFLHVDSDTAYRMMKSMGLTSRGTYKNRSYRMDFT